MTYEVLALRYASTGPGRLRRDNFIVAVDAHDGPMPLDYFIWAIRDGERTVVVDTGFGADAAARRGRSLMRTPAQALQSVGIDPATVEDVILTHLHYDHAGGLDAFPRARFHLQDDEMAYATGRPVCHACLRNPFEVDDVVDVVRLVYAGRVVFHAGEGTVAPGITVHRIGGHTGGLQAVRVATARGPLVIGSDAFHFSENRKRRTPFPLVYNVGEMLEGYLRCEALAGGDDTLLIPGHDPEVLRRWPRFQCDDPDAVKLHEAPTAP
jgi:glyoxylase-like metal-dependent hydrolase (beta-lactamase superfamily II)